LLWYILLILGCLFLLTTLYLWFLAIVSLLPWDRTNTDQPHRTKFAVIIPAHNEAKVIQRTISSLKHLDYPQANYEAIVVADNCSDNTAQVAKENSATCFERLDGERKGKGCALQWIFAKLKGTPYDAFVIIDADTIIDPNFLQAMDSRIAKGEMAIQGYYDVINPEESPMASLSYLGFVLSRNLRYKGRTRLGWSNNLLGNGMCFAREVIARFGWNAKSIVEDVEYAVMLHLNGVRVCFAPEAKIFAEIPRTFKESRIQRSRWDIGKFQVRNKHLFQLCKKAIKTKDASYVDTAMELLIPPFSLFVTLYFALFTAFLVISFDGINPLTVIWFTGMLGLIAYIVIGLGMARASWKIYKNLVYAPFFLVWRVETVVWGYLSRIGNQWLKTERE
jgi:cellulose synthase/poly-beta-1,6-N-acetylglucosamine synthase-like glycosyltransferase